MNFRATSLNHGVLVHMLGAGDVAISREEAKAFASQLRIAAGEPVKELRPWKQWGPDLTGSGIFDSDNNLIGIVKAPTDAAAIIKAHNEAIGYKEPDWVAKAAEALSLTTHHDQNVIESIIRKHAPKS